MLWDLIRDFFVEHIFGGVASSGNIFYTKLGTITNSDFSGSELNLNDLMLPLKDTYNYQADFIGTHYIGLGDWLSTTATIITISIIVVLCCLFVYKIIKLIGGLIR